MYKNCYVCKQQKSLDNFGKRKNGLRSECKECSRELSKAYVEKNKEKVLEKARIHSKAYAATHKEERKAYNKQWREANKEYLSYKNKQWRENNKEYASEKMKEWHQANREVSLQKMRERREKNKDRYNETQRKYNQNNKELLKEKRKANYEKDKQKYFARATKYKKERAKVDPAFRISLSLRARLNTAVRNNYKAGSAISDLGCSVEELKVYLESKFQPGMSWDNYGKKGWHIDHIRALANFDLTDREQVKEACHYTNLQPMWALENILKSNKN
jgi:hypothetical protein